MRRASSPRWYFACMVFLGWDPRSGRYATISYYPIYRCLPPLKAPGAATITGKLRRINIGIRKSTAKATKSTPICSGSTGPDLATANNRIYYCRIFRCFSSVVIALTCHYATSAAGTGIASASGTPQPFLSIFRSRASV